MSLTIPAYAKLNLLLKVQSRRADGYHEVEMVMQTISLSDKLVFTPAPVGVSLSVDGADLPVNEDNLVVRAARLVQHYTGCRWGVQIFLQKNIPVEAGLGGGSADAAATLVGLNRLWGLGLTVEELYRLGAQLGSDVPFCITGGTMLAQGRGEILTPLPLAPAMGLVLVKPPYGISTARVYQGLNLTPGEFYPYPGPKQMLKAIEEQDLPALCRALDNDLEAVAFRLHPHLAQVKRILLDQGAIGALMSGSGSTVFGITRSLREAEDLARRLDLTAGTVYTAVLMGRRKVLQ